MISRSSFTGALLGALVLSGVSTRNSVAAATSTADPDATTVFNVYLPLTNTDTLDSLLGEQTDANSPQYHQWLTPVQFKQKFGPSPTSFATARAALESAGFTIVAEHRRVQLAGSNRDLPSGQRRQRSVQPRLG